MLHAIDVLANIFGSVNPFLFAVSFLNIVLEFTLVLAAIDVDVLSESIGHVIFETALVDVPLGMPECALAFSSVVGPFPLVVGSVGPELDSVSMSNNRGNIIILILFVFGGPLGILGLHHLVWVFALLAKSVLESPPALVAGVRLVVGERLEEYQFLAHLLVHSLHLPPVHRIIRI